MSGSGVLALLKDTYTEWSDHNATRFGASLAFYTLLSLAPLLLLFAAVLALVFSQSQIQTQLVNQASQMIGSRGAEAVRQLLESAQKPANGAIASIVAFLTLLWGASSVTTELREALNAMWDAKPRFKSGVMGMIKDKLFSFGMVLSIGFLLLVSLLLSAALSFVGKFFGQIVPLPPAVLQVANFVVSFLVITALFGLMFKFVPAAKIEWRDVMVGAVGTALLFTVGKLLLGLYLGKASVGSAYGAAGSLVAVVIWVYYSAQIFLFGAEFTHVYANQQGSLRTASAGSATNKKQRTF